MGSTGSRKASRSSYRSNSPEDGIQASLNRNVTPVEIQYSHCYLISMAHLRSSKVEDKKGIVGSGKRILVNNGKELASRNVET